MGKSDGLLKDKVFWLSFFDIGSVSFFFLSSLQLLFKISNAMTVTLVWMTKKEERILSSAAKCQHTLQMGLFFFKLCL